MSPRSCSSISSKSRLILIGLMLAQFSCAKSIVSSSSSSSNLACAGDGGLIPTPVGPQAYRTLAKFSVPASMFKSSTAQNLGGAEAVLPAQSSLLAIVNDACVAAQPMGSDYLSQQLREAVDQQGSLWNERAYPLTTRQPYSSTTLQAMAEADPCLLSLSEDSIVYKSETVNDPGYATQIHLPAIEASYGWDTFYSGLTGTTVIAIIDDGMQLNHPEFSSILWTNTGEIAGNSIDDDGNGYVDDVHGYNFATGIGSPAHENGATHGTHVAGLAAAQDNNGIGITGVMGRNVRIMVLNVFGASASSSSAYIFNAINYARNNGAHVANMSLGGSGTAASVGAAMGNAVGAGVFFAVAAGNSNQLVTEGNFYQPMGYAKDIEGAMAVGSVDATSLLKSSFSNYSTTFVEIAAPGSNSATGGVYSTFPTSTYSHLQGTSMSSPILAGAAALVIGWVNGQGKTITPAQVESMLKASATPSSNLTPYFYGGFLLNVRNLATTATCSF